MQHFLYIPGIEMNVSLLATSLYIYIFELHLSIKACQLLSSLSLKVHFLCYNDSGVGDGEPVAVMAKTVIVAVPVPVVAAAIAITVVAAITVATTEITTITEAVAETTTLTARAVALN